MKKILLALLATTVTMLNTPVQASQAKDALFSLINAGTAINFSAINQTIINETTNNQFPSPGDTFITNGFGVLETPLTDVELTYSYSIAGTFTEFDGSKLFFNHEPVIPEITNQLMLYVDSSLNANEDIASSYTDGLLIATMDALPGNDDQIGYIEQSTGSGEDKVTFKLIDSDLERYGLSNNILVLNKITSDISLVDFAGGQPQAFNFGAFNTSNSTCGPLANPYNSCSREVGTSRIIVSSVPVPSAVGLFLSGFGLLGWLKKRK